MEDDYGSLIPLGSVQDDLDVYQLPKDMRDGSDVLDQMIQLDLVKNKKGKDFLNRYMGMTA